MASRRSRNRRDKRAESEEFLDLGDAPAEPEDSAELVLHDGSRIDPRTPWPMPGRNTTDTERTNP